MREIKQLETLVRELRGQKYVAIITFARGGLLTAQYLSYALDVEQVFVFDSTKAIPAKFHIAKGRALFCDDIADSGKTILEMRERLGDIDTAVLFKRHSCKVPVDYYGEVIEHDDYHLFSWDKFAERMKDA